MRRHLQTKPSLIDTAEFRKLVRIDAQPGDGPGPDTGGRQDYSNDLLVKTAKLRKLELQELDVEPEGNPGVDPYNSATPAWGA